MAILISSSTSSTSCNNLLLGCSKGAKQVVYTCPGSSTDWCRICPIRPRHGCAMSNDPAIPAYCRPMIQLYDHPIVLRTTQSPAMQVGQDKVPVRCTTGLFLCPYTKPQPRVYRSRGSKQLTDKSKSQLFIVFIPYHG